MSFMILSQPLRRSLLLSSLVALGACSTSAAHPPSHAPMDVCASLLAYSLQCHADDPCTQAMLQNCLTLAPTFSQAMLDATDACGRSFSCADAGADVVQDTCVTSQLASATPTAAQAKVKDDFCRACPDSPSHPVATACSDFFGDGPGAGIVAFDDATAERIDQRCALGAQPSDGGLGGDCMLAFQTCVGDLIGLDDPNVAQACVHWQGD